MFQIPRPAYNPDWQAAQIEEAKSTCEKYLLREDAGVLDKAAALNRAFTAGIDCAEAHRYHWLIRLVCWLLGVPLFTIVFLWLLSIAITMVKELSNYL